jgi:predicted SnoaL-like aldol condensation-catalyzing enzyme
MSSNKESAKSFLRLTALGEVEEAFSKHVSPSMKHHNQYFKGDGESLKSAMQENASKMPNKVFEIKMMLEDQDRVMAFSQLKTSTMELAVVHIMKFRDGKIVELWDLTQPLSKDSPNENGMF